MAETAKPSLAQTAENAADEILDYKSNGRPNKSFRQVVYDAIHRAWNRGAAAGAVEYDPPPLPHPEHDDIHGPRAASYRAADGSWLHKETPNG